METEGGKTLVLFMKRGECLSNDPWRDEIASLTSAQTRWIPLSAQGALMVKLLMQTTGGKSEAIAIPFDVNKVLERSKKAAPISLVRFEWESALGAVLFHGSDEKPYSLYLTAKQVEEQMGVTSPLVMSNSQNCIVTAFAANLSIAVWKEYLLRRAFADICEGVLSQFQALVGRALADSLIRLVLVFAARRHLQISFITRKVTDEEYFASPQEAAEQYRSLLNEILAHCSGITGSRLLSSALHEIVNKLPEQECAIINEFSLLNKGYTYETSK